MFVINVLCLFRPYSIKIPLLINLSYIYGLEMGLTDMHYSLAEHLLSAEIFGYY